MFLFWKKEKDTSGDVCITDSKLTGGTPFVQAENRIRENPNGIKILGTNAELCLAMKEAVEEVLARMGLNKTVEYINDLNLIAAYGVIHTPALVIDGKLVSTGRMLNSNEIAALVKKSFS